MNVKSVTCDKRSADPEYHKKQVESARAEAIKRINGSEAFFVISFTPEINGEGEMQASSFMTPATMMMLIDTMPGMRIELMKSFVKGITDNLPT